MSSDDDDLNNELLQVAGGRTTSSKRGRAPASEASMSQEALDDDEASDGSEYGGGSRRRVARSPARKRRAAAPSEDEEVDEEAEADDLEAFEDGYGSDLMGDDEDRVRLAALTELDREMELADRAEARENAAERRRMLQKQQKPRTPARKARPAARASTRSKKPDNQAKQSAMEELKAARARKAQPRRDRQDQDWDGESPDVSGDEADAAAARRSGARGPPSASGSEEAAARSAERSPAPASDEEADEADRRDRDDDAFEEAAFEDIGAVCVRRYKLEAWLAKPFLERTLPGCLLRVSLGERTTSTGVTASCYMLAQVVEVEMHTSSRVRDMTGRAWENPYRFGPKNARTNKWAKVRRGDSHRLVPFALVSNSGPTEEEWESWQREEDKAQRQRLTNEDVSAARQRLIDAETYKFTAEDVQRMVEEKRQRGGRNTAAERARLDRDLQYARETDNFEEAARLQEVLAVLQDRAQAEAERGARNSMASVNQRNKGVNFSNAFKDVSARPEGSMIDAAGNDPFSRRKTESRNYWATRRNRGPEDETAAAEAGQLEALAGPEAEAEEHGAPAARAHQDDETGLVELDIDLSVLSLPRPPLIATKLLGPDWRASLSRHAAPPDLRNRRQLSLADYKKHQGIA